MSAGILDNVYQCNPRQSNPLFFSLPFFCCFIEVSSCATNPVGMTTGKSASPAPAVSVLFFSLVGAGLLLRLADTRVTALRLDSPNYSYHSLLGSHSPSLDSPEESGGEENDEVPEGSSEYALIQNSTGELRRKICWPSRLHVFVRAVLFGDKAFLFSLRQSPCTLSDL